MYDEQYSQTEKRHPGRTWTDDQLAANCLIVAMLQGTEPPVGLHPFATSTRFVHMIQLLSEVLHIEQASRLFQEALLANLGYDYDAVIEGKDEFACRREGV